MLRCRHLLFKPHIPCNRQFRVMSRALDFRDGPLVWVDCEMTGLDPRKDKILEIAVLITNGNLDIVDDGIQYVIHTKKNILNRMGEWCTKQHAQSGLTQACLTSPYSHDYVAKAVLDYIKKWIPDQRVGVLAGNSVHADRSFLVEAMPEVVDWLHYRIVDVSSIKELSRRWYAQEGIAPQLGSSHRYAQHTFYSQDGEGAPRALDDIHGSIKELQWYRQNIFLPLSPQSTVAQLSS